MPVYKDGRPYIFRPEVEGLLLQQSSSSRRSLPLRFDPANANAVDFLVSIMGIFRSLVSLVAAAAVASASPIERRVPIGSDQVVGFAETVPSGTTGSVYLAYKPFLKVVNGCVPFPAVNAAGDTKCVSLFLSPDWLAGRPACGDR